MSYVVLARKYRPQIFDEVIGQEHITGILKKAIEAKRLAHAYLFCGPRGIGKTSCARILAKSLNCQEGPTLVPCGKCSPCKEIAASTSFDVIEIDAASNRGIDEIRLLRENVKFAPSAGRYKIYIIDEVHMLTTEAFNALLKTLEEPPEHVKFILATTAVQKLPATIISRCQRFDFKRVSVKITTEVLDKISQKECLKIDPEALYAIAKASQGSLRDALSILDQLSSLREKKIEAGDVFVMLGVVETELLFKLADSIAQKDPAQAFEILDDIIERGKDIKQLTKDMIEHFRNLMIVKIGEKSLGRLIDYPANLKDQLLTQCQYFSLKDILEAIEVFIASQETSRITESLRTPLEIALVKITYPLEKREVKIPFSPPTEKKKIQPEPAASFLKNEKGKVSMSLPEPLEEEKGEPDESSPSESLTIEQVRKSWDNLTYAISREKMSVATLLQEAGPHSLEKSKLIIALSSKNTFQKEALETLPNKQLVERILSERLKQKISINYKIIDDHKPAEEEPVVKNVLDAFKGKVVSKWHNE